MDALASTVGWKKKPCGAARARLAQVQARRAHARGRAHQGGDTAGRRLTAKACQARAACTSPERGVAASRCLQKQCHWERIAQHVGAVTAGARVGAGAPHLVVGRRQVWSLAAHGRRRALRDGVIHVALHLRPRAPVLRRLLHRAGHHETPTQTPCRFLGRRQRASSGDRRVSQSASLLPLCAEVSMQACIRHARCLYARAMRAAAKRARVLRGQRTASCDPLGACTLAPCAVCCMLCAAPCAAMRRAAGIPGRARRARSRAPGPPRAR
jgi:hypothetical protein